MDASQNNSQTPSTPTTWEQRLPEPVVKLVRWLVERGIAGAAAAVGVVVLLAGGLIGLSWLLTPGETPPETPPEDPCQLALAELDNDRFPLVREMAYKLSDISALPPKDWGVPSYLLGVAAAKEADQSSDAITRRSESRIAAKYLEECRERGYPEGREAEGAFWLAQSLVGAQRYTAAIPALRAAYDLNFARRHELAPMLAAAYLGASSPQPREALIWSDRHLANKLLNREEREAALVQRANILAALDQPAEARAALAEVPPESPSHAEALLAAARVLLREAEPKAATKEKPAETPTPEAAHAARTQAMKTLRQVLALTRLPQRTHHAAAYLLGLALWQDHDLKAALAQFARVRRTSGGEPEALAATLAEAEVSAALQADPTETTDLYLDAFQLAAKPVDSDNPWLTTADLEERAIGGYRKFLEAGQFDWAAKLAAALPAFVAKWKRLHLVAETEVAWAKKLLTEAEPLKEEDAAKLREQACLHYRSAAKAFGEAAQQRIAEREYPDDMWACADCYWLGRGYRQAQASLEKFLESGAGSRTPDALVRLAEVQLALGQSDRCLATIGRALEDYPKHPVTYRARLIAAQAGVQEGKLEQARQWLLDNLENEHLTPKSLEWRDALFALGEVLYKEGTLLDAQVRLTNTDQARADEKAALAAKLDKSHQLLVDATRRLAEAVERYPDAPQRIEAEYFLAEAHRMASRVPRERLASATIESTRHGLADEMRRQLLAAIEHYAALQTRLNERHRPTLSEQRMLRNCYFAQGGAWFDLGEYRKAIDAYSTATNLYQNDPAALEAYVQIANCYRRLSRPFDARAMVEQAKTVLKNMPQGAKFDATTRFSREEWTRLLDWMASL